MPPNELSSRTVVGWLLDFALSNKDTFVVAMRELHGPIGPAREAIKQGMAQAALGVFPIRCAFNSAGLTGHCAMQT